mmetsp:Transcript_39084/g.123323  ORF Transcript_39084/g.123323 Transcript_39084/m.123323 type:complete len:329 (+) Transcript_39084:772-1758(+)
MSLLEPRRADAGRVRGRQADLEAAVPVEQRRRRAVERQPLLADEEVRHRRAVGRRGGELLRRHASRVVKGRERLERLCCVGRAGGGESEGRRLGVPVRGAPEVVGRLCVHRREARREADLPFETPLEREGAVGVPPESALGHDVVEAGEDEVVLRLGRRLQRARLGGGEERREQRRARGVVTRHHEALRRSGEQRARGVAEPRGAERHEELVGERADVCVCGDRDGRPSRLADLELVRGGVEGERAVPQLVPPPAVEVRESSDRHVRLLALVHLCCLGERRAPPPLPHAARVAAVRHLPLAEDSADEQRVAVLVRELALRLGQLEAAV